MNWKDWLYIPKSDKIAILALLTGIAILLIITFWIGLQPKDITPALTTHIPTQYQDWQKELNENINKEELEFDTPSYNTHFQAKMNKGQTIELNSADTNQLKTIPGIGSMFAHRIVKYREALGGYACIEQLNEVWGLDTYLYSSITPYLTLEPLHDSIFINTDSFQKLISHPYINYKQALAITDIRERKGTIKSIKRLMLLEEFKQEDIRRLSRYANFSIK